MKAKMDSSIFKAVVEEEARKIRAEIDFAASSTTRALKDFVGAIGGKIEYCPPDGTHEETLSVMSQNDFTIFLPENSSEARDNFTIAHELGHFFLHVDFEAEVAGEPVRFTRRGSNRAEWEANWFAAELLMPADEFKRRAESLRNDPDLLAQEFGVSSRAAAVRLKVLLDI